MCVSSQSLSHVQLFMTPWTAAHQAPLSVRFSRQGHWSGLPFPSPGDLPNPGNQSRVSCTADRFFTDWATREAPDDPAVPLLGIYLKKMKTLTWKAICASTVTAALFTMGTTRKQLRCPLVDEWIKKIWYTHTLEYYSAIKNKIVSKNR